MEKIEPKEEGWAKCNSQAEGKQQNWLIQNRVTDKKTFCMLMLIRYISPSLFGSLFLFIFSI